MQQQQQQRQKPRSESERERTRRAITITKQATQAENNKRIPLFLSGPKIQSNFLSLSLCLPSPANESSPNESLSSPWSPPPERLTFYIALAGRQTD